MSYRTRTIVDRSLKTRSGVVARVAQAAPNAACANSDRGTIGIGEANPWISDLDSLDRWKSGFRRMARFWVCFSTRAHARVESCRCNVRVM